MFHIKKSNIQDDYFIDEDYIGEGGFALVKRAYSKEGHNAVALKIYERCLMDATDEMNLENEINILNQIDHPNIVKLFQVYQDNTHWYLVLEYMTGGELFDRIIQKEHYTEDQAKTVLLPIIDALRYLHDLGIVHRDLKPENLLYGDDKPNAVIKLADFGVSKIITNNRMSSKVGTPSYFAPEVLQANGYTLAVDYWSLGIVLYILLSGSAPFYEQNQEILYEKILKGEYEFPEQDWSQISAQAIDFIKKLLVVDPSQRLSSNTILEHPWIKMQCSDKGGQLKAPKTLQSYVTKVHSQRPQNIKKFLKYIEQRKEQ